MAGFAQGSSPASPTSSWLVMVDLDELEVLIGLLEGDFELIGGEGR